MPIGYARVSTSEQDTTTQAAALRAAGCERIFREKATGGRATSTSLGELLSFTAGDFEAIPVDRGDLIKHYILSDRDLSVIRRPARSVISQPSPETIN